MSTDSGLPPLGPGAQAVRLSFWFVAAVAILAASAWAGSNIRRIPPDSRAVVLRFGAFVRTQDAGLLIAWPRLFETAVMVPGRARVLELHIDSLDRDARARRADAHVPAALSGADARNAAGQVDMPPLPASAAGSGIAASASAAPMPALPAETAAPSFEPDPDEAPAASTLLPDALAGSGYLLTGDNGAFQLHATLYYRVVDAYAS